MKQSSCVEHTYNNCCDYSNNGYKHMADLAKSCIHRIARSQQGPLQASIDERSEELTELVGDVGESAV